MANTLITSKIISRLAPISLKNNCVAGKQVMRSAEKEFKKRYDTVTLRKPPKFIVSDGAEMQIQDIKEPSVDLKYNYHKHVAFEWPLVDKTLTIEDQYKNYFEPALIPLVNEVDRQICTLAYQASYFATGTAGTAPAGVDDVINAKVRMSEMAIPDDARKLLLSPKAYGEIQKGLKGLFLPVRVGEIVDKGILGSPVQGFEIYEDQNVVTHTAGTGSAYTVNGASQEGSSITITGGSGTILKGDVITFAGSNAVNPINKQSTGNLMQFAVTADVASGGTSVSISPAIVLTGAFQNVSAAPTDGGALTITANHTANLAYNKNAIQLCMSAFEKPDSANAGEFYSSDYDGFVVTVSKSWNQQSYKESIRFDVLFGVAIHYPEFILRLLG